MVETYLIPPSTRVTAAGDGAAVDISAAGHRVFLATLVITDIVEQEALDVSIWGSADGAAWGTQPVARFPQKFYRGQHPLLVDLTGQPDIKFLRAHWDVNRWGRGSLTPMFELHVTLREVPKDVLAEVSATARTRT
ncbi:MAG TPA: hypothetical protein VNK82_08395 [Terriglobales bacterium]|nr:hypothetical protein [Terriglobales bacterium]